MLVRKLRSGRAIRIGDTVIHVSHARRGEVKLAIDAPQEVVVEVLPKSSMRGDACRRCQRRPCLPTCSHMPF